MLVLFFILLFVVCGKLTIWGIKAAWSIGKFILTVFFWPLILICMIIGGLLHYAFIALIIIGIITLISSLIDAR